MVRYASFFTGAMGLDLGLEQAGWECVFANEADKVACRTVRSNRPGLRLVEGDIRSLAPGSLRFGNALDMVVGGPPCQAFSTAGRRLGLNDERGNVFLHFLDLALALGPKLIVIENVRGLLSAPLLHRPHAERGFDFPPMSPDELRGGALSHILSTLKHAGYEVTFDLYDTANFGIPQRRERLVLVGSKVGRAPYLAPTHGGPGQPRWRTFAEAVEGLHGHQDFAPLRERQARYLRHLGPGQNWRDLPEDQRREALGNAYECGGGRTGFLRRLAWDAPAPTMVTSPTMPATLLAHPVDLRPLSVQEYARVQTFPDEWRFEGKLAQRYRQIGNAVPVHFGLEVGRQLRRFLDGSGLASDGAKRSNSRYRGTDDGEWARTLVKP